MITKEHKIDQEDYKEISNYAELMIVSHNSVLILMEHVYYVIHIREDKIQFLAPVMEEHVAQISVLIYNGQIQMVHVYLAPSI